MLKNPVGIHVSIAGNLASSVQRAVEVGCVGTFQIFTCSPRRWTASPLDPLQAVLFKDKISELEFVPFAHMPYMPNLSSPDDRFYTESVKVLVREINRCEELGVKGVVVHFGSHMGSSIENGHSRIISGCKEAIKATSSSKVRILLENSAGVRNSVGSKFEYVEYVLEQIGDMKRTGVCFDTCHAFACGYDLRTIESVKKTIAEFDRIIGLEKLHLIHANDSMGDLGEGKDRHEHLGLGKIGQSGFKSLFSNESIKGIPLILETPTDGRRGDKQNVAYAKSLVES